MFFENKQYISILALSMFATQAFASNGFTHTVMSNEYLSSVLKEKSYVNGHTIIWLSESNKVSQKKQKQEILDYLKRDNSVSNSWIASWVENLDVTGRATIPVNNVNLMEVNPKLNPLLKVGDTVLTKNLSSQIQLITSAGTLCTLPFVAGKTVADYASACKIDTDTIYLIDAMGNVHIQQNGVWSDSAKRKVTSGATLWIPVAKNPLNNAINKKIAKTLALQVNDDYGITALQQNYATSDIRNLSSGISAPMTTSLSNNGMTGVVFTPSARTQKTGEVSFAIRGAKQQKSYGMTLQPTDNIELGFNYIGLSKKFFEKENQKSLKDTAFNVKVLLNKESKYVPAVAVGLNDPLRMGVFGGEYFVANKRYKSLDISAGLGFGVLGSKGSDVLKQNIATKRDGYSGFTNKQWFADTPAFFAGLLWQTPIQPLALKLEYDGAYKTRALQDKLKSPVNLGIQWQNNDYTTSFGVQGGSKLTAGITLHANIADIVTSNQSPNYLSKLGTGFSSSFDFGKENSITQKIAQLTGIAVIKIIKEPNKWTLVTKSASSKYLKRKLNSLMTLLNQSAKPDVKSFVFETYNHGQPLTKVSVDRQDWVVSQQSYTPAEQQKKIFTAQPNTTDRTIASAVRVGLSPSLEQSFSGTNGLNYAVNLNASLYAPITNSTWINGNTKISLLNNYEDVTVDNTKFTTKSNQNDSFDVRPTNLQVNHVSKISDNIFVLGYAGYLADMFAGVGSEIMYRSFASNLAVGFDVNHLRQRSANNALKITDAKLNSGHITAYYDTGFNGINIKAKLGKYLAGDNGGTLDVSKKFTNGARMGVWATKTNKTDNTNVGLYFDVPFDAILDNFSTRDVKSSWSPALNNAGAVLNRTNSLWTITKDYDPKLLEYQTKQP